MATTISAGNATNGLALTADNTGALEFKTGSGAGTTALTLSSSQIATFSTGVALPTGSLYPLVSGTAKTTTTTSFTGATSGSSATLTASAVTGTIQVGQLITGTNVTAGTTILAQLTGTPGGAGTYTMSTLSSGTVSGTITVVGVDFYNIPSTAKRITVMLNGVSMSGTSNLLIQVGSSSFSTSGYTSAASREANNIGSTAGFIQAFNTAAAALTIGQFTLNLQTGNSWVGTGLNMRSDVNALNYCAGSISLSGTLDRVRITTVNGTDTFDAGSINIMWE